MYENRTLSEFCNGCRDGRWIIPRELHKPLLSPSSVHCESASGDCLGLAYVSHRWSLPVPAHDYGSPQIHRVILIHVALVNMRD